MDNKLEVKFKLMFAAQGQQKKKTYLTKFQSFLSDIKNVLTKDVTRGVVKISNIEIQLKSFYVDKHNDQTLVQMTVVIVFEGAIKEAQRKYPQYIESLVDFTEGWLNTFTPAKKKATKKKTATPESERTYSRNRTIPRNEKNEL